ncbi:hypothetical protein SDRG_06399 [Saprolegnia diclina VS20]|uniref:Uncharacterized protein n=1 Tax=Saprolegnia diclina (strain VS20) TaxID=1156394 RepID=T0QEF8_SAPDV|nr:hypothetical protein SDRG_06399 [Saprolegnia diclina VS20]EQC36294.1 hypothetical protein SDRG_06399 [Saprolegnia diclina VS20]|eukprot:XP_008610400.1 hypothetical protein SDRG_06399 [Saprolegnia diclina VS20]
MSLTVSNGSPLMRAATSKDTSLLDASFLAAIDDAVRFEPKLPASALERALDHDTSCNCAEHRRHHYRGDDATSLDETKRQRRQRAIEKRNQKRHITPQRPALRAPTVLVDTRNNRLASAKYRANCRERTHRVDATIQEMLARYPTYGIDAYAPTQLIKSERRHDESLDAYRKRTNREAADFSRQEQRRKLQFYKLQLQLLTTRILSNEDDYC